MAGSPGSGKSLIISMLVNRVIEERRRKGKVASILLITGSGITYSLKEHIDNYHPDRGFQVIQGSKERAWGDQRRHIIGYGSVWAQIHDTQDGFKYDLVVCDESHYMLNPGSLQSVGIIGGVPDSAIEELGYTEASKYAFDGIASRRFVFMTGTPFNKPRDLFSIVKTCDPDGLGKDRQAYEKRYCGGRWFDNTWYNSGTTNLNELLHKIRKFTFVIDPPVPDIEFIPILLKPVDLIKEAEENVIKESGILDYLQNMGKANNRKGEVDYGEARRVIADEAFNAKMFKKNEIVSETITRISKVRSELAELRVKPVKKWIKKNLKDVDKLVIFAQHTSLLEGLYEKFNKKNEAVIISGKVKPKLRPEIVKQFQEDAKIKYFLGQSKAASENNTLTSAHHLVLAEPVWSGIQFVQIIRRIQRIVQVEDCKVYIILIDETVDSQVYERCREYLGNIRTFYKAFTPEVKAEIESGKKNYLARLKHRN